MNFGPPKSPPPPPPLDVPYGVQRSVPKDVSHLRSIQSSLKTTPPSPAPLLGKKRRGSSSSYNATETTTTTPTYLFPKSEKATPLLGQSHSLLGDPMPNPLARFDDQEQSPLLGAAAGGGGGGGRRPPSAAALLPIEAEGQETSLQSKHGNPYQKAVLPHVDIIDVESHASTPLLVGSFEHKPSVVVNPPSDVHSGNVNHSIAHSIANPNSEAKFSKTSHSEPERTHSNLYTALANKKKKALKGLLGLQKDDDKSLERQATGLTHITEAEQSHAMSENVLREFDIDKLRHAFSKLDVQGDGGLELFEFRLMWKAVFPQRPMDQEAWKATQFMFQDIDSDTSGIITFEEIVFYLEKNRREELQRTKRPKSLFEWVWQFVGNNVGRGWTRGDGDICIKVAIYTWKILAQILVFVQCAIVFIESEPSMQNEDDYPGTETLWTLDIACNIFFSVEFVLWMLSHPITVKVDDSSMDDMESHLCASDTEVVKVHTVCHPNRVQIFGYGQFWMELVALASFYSRAFVGAEAIGARPFVVIRMFRIMRLLRAFRVISKKIGVRKRGKEGVKRAPELGQALKKSFISLGFLLALVIVAVTVSSALVFYAEQHEAHFDFTTETWIRNADSSYVDAGFPTLFQSIPDSMWWAIVTLTTVGYGDKAPATIPGKFVASAIMLAGLIVVGFPITILTSTFQVCHTTPHHHPLPINTPTGNGEGAHGRGTAYPQLQRVLRRHQTLARCGG